MSPYVSEPDLNEPDNDAKIWRYMDFTKLLSILENNGLFFTVARIFREKYDYFEGAYPDHWLKYYFPPDARSGFQSMCDTFWAFKVLNCWHINDFESDAMWKIYSSRGYGFAIQSSFQILKTSFEDTKNRVFAGKVHYIDYEKDIVPFDKAIKAYFYKRKIFEHEQEFRVVAEIDFEEPYIPGVNGCYINMDVNKLIENIYVSPNSSQWVILLLNDILERYGIEAEVIKSDLLKKPKFRI